MSINQVTLLGNCGQDPEIRTFESGDKVANFRIATSERWKDKQSGEQKERTEWHTICVFGAIDVEKVGEKIKKGSMVFVHGRLTTRKWQDQHGNDRYSTEVHVRFPWGRVEAIDKMPPMNDRGLDHDPYRSDGGSSAGGSYRREFDEEKHTTDRRDDPMANAQGSFAGELDDSIPF